MDCLNEEAKYYPRQIDGNRVSWIFFVGEKYLLGSFGSFYGS
jgi:hypothetical protein